MNARYARQMVVPDVGPDGQRRLAQARVLVVGAGGLGAPVLSYLAGAGVGHIDLIDPDHVSLDNLHRQVLFQQSDIGRSKVRAAAERVHALNDQVYIATHAKPLDPINAPHLIADADVVVDAADSFAVTYTLSDACRDLQTPLVSASALGWQGHVGGFCGGAPSCRAVFPDLPQRMARCAEAGVLGPAVGMLGSLQAQMTLHLLLGWTPTPLGTLLRADLRDMVFSRIDFCHAEEPHHTIAFIAHDHVRADDHVIDLRAADEPGPPAAPHAMRMNLDTLPPQLPDIDTRIVLCCRSGLRAWHGAQRLHAGGHRDLALLALGA